MKTNLINKDLKFSLTNPENYKKDFDCNVSEIINKYAELIIEYSRFIHENNKIKNKSFSTFIMIRGLDTITHVFDYILYVTKNIELTYYHCQKSFYFYIEFVGQITEDDKMFLKLTTRDATTYVYKKTIYDIHNNMKKENNFAECNETMNIIQCYIKLYQTYLLKIIHGDVVEIEKLEHVVKLKDSLNNITNKSNIYALENITDLLYYKIENVERFFEISHLIVKHFLKHPESLEKAKDKWTQDKWTQDEWDEKLQDSNEKFVHWLLI
jgi:hypothetical protein